MHINIHLKTNKTVKKCAKILNRYLTKKTYMLQIRLWRNICHKETWIKQQGQIPANLLEWLKSGQWEPGPNRDTWKMWSSMKSIHCWWRCKMGCMFWWLFTKLNILLCFSNSVLLHVSERKKKLRPDKNLPIYIYIYILESTNTNVTESAKLVGIFHYKTLITVCFAQNYATMEETAADFLLQPQNRSLFFKAWCLSGLYIRKGNNAFKIFGILFYICKHILSSEKFCKLLDKDNYLHFIEVTLGFLKSNLSKAMSQVSGEG